MAATAGRRPRRERSSARARPSGSDPAPVSCSRIERTRDAATGPSVFRRHRVGRTPTASRDSGRYRGSGHTGATMKYLRLPVLAAITAIAAGCAYRPNPIELHATPADVAALA